MTQTDIISLERDVEQARRRFAESLARVRSPAAVEELKDDLLEAKDEAIHRARGAVQETLSRFADELKERAAANPAAALAIGAGLLWRLVHRPPIASLLVGVGAISLFRTPAGQNSGRAIHVPGKEVIHQAAEFTKEKIQDVTESAKAVGRDAVSQVSETATRLVDRSYEFADNLAENSTARDHYLLGAAALAVGAAMIIAYQKRDE
jgi:hypothetical protein